MKRYIRLSDDDMTDDDMLNYQDAIDGYDFYEIENSVAEELGIYLDFSSIRGDSGTIFIFSDPEQENSGCDVWLGDEDAELGYIDFEDYTYFLENEVFTQPEDQWRSIYKKYIQSKLD